MKRRDQGVPGVGLGNGRLKELRTWQVLLGDAHETHSTAARTTCAAKCLRPEGMVSSEGLGCMELRRHESFRFRANTVLPEKTVDEQKHSDGSGKKTF